MFYLDSGMLELYIYQDYMEKNTAAEGDRNERKKTRDNARRLSGG